jgi:hypothetical protein
MGEVDELDDAVYERVAEGDEGEDQSISKPDDDRLDELVQMRWPSASAASEMVRDAIRGGRNRPPRMLFALRWKR